ncbi:hypothetical protein [Pedobacter sp. KLB.chiD]|uniref:hypothetical protein n=1 Tax=Pedobacter sp. KLB.chiD TaxID=3387402 RepID=UPI00399C45F2
MNIYLGWAKKNKHFFQDGEIDKIQDYCEYLFDRGFDQEMALIKRRETRIRALSSLQIMSYNKEEIENKTA